MTERSGLPEFASLVRASDTPRYFASLFLPHRERSEILALAALKCELSAIADRVSEPALGEIRIQWWAEQLAKSGEQVGGETPLLRALSATVHRHRLPLDALTLMAEVHRSDLYSDPPATMNDLEGYLGETESALFQLSALCLGGDAAHAQIAGHAGVAYGLARRLAKIGIDRRAGRTIVPSSLLEEHSLTPGSYFDVTADKLVPLVATLSATTRDHLDAASALLPALSRNQRVIYLPLVTIVPTLRQIERLGAEIFKVGPTINHAATLARMAMRAFLP